MQIVIDIEEKIFEEITKYDEPIPSGNRLYDSALLSIYNGVPLPKHHGRLKDVDRLESHDEYDGQGFTKSVYKDDIDNAPTIIEGSESE